MTEAEALWHRLSQRGPFTVHSLSPEGGACVHPYNCPSIRFRADTLEEALRRAEAGWPEPGEFEYHGMAPYRN